MRRIILILTLLGSLSFANAADYKYLVLTTTDGSTINLTADGLTLTFSDGNLVASDGTTVTLTSLSKMFFSETAGIHELTITDSDADVDVYTTSGMYVGRYDSSTAAMNGLEKGLYVLKSNGVSKKVVVK